jgi:hypothetical protein
MTEESEKDMEGSVRLIAVLSQHLPGGTEEIELHLEIQII